MGGTARLPRHIALLPLDDRPVNIALPKDVARVAGWIVETPPAAILPNYREPGDTSALSAWLVEQAQNPATEHLIVSLDMLCYGGLIASRTSRHSMSETLSRLDILRTIKEMRPDLPISVVSLVMRASNSYSAAEEPEYWEDYGKDLHQLGATIHTLDAANENIALTDLTHVPAHIVSDYATRRVRNHVLNLAALILVQDRTIDFLAITADDTATFSAGSAEQQWLGHWMRFLPSGSSVLMYPGADEVGAVLVARAMSDATQVSPTVRVSCPDPEGLSRTPLFENVPLEISVKRQIRAAGATQISHNGLADVVLVVHSPDPALHDMTLGYPDHDDLISIRATAQQIEAELEAGNLVALADVRYPNGADARLIQTLIENGTLRRLVAFGGWNTAGNTLGGVIATAVAAVVGQRTDSVSTPAIEQALLVRVLDDYGYQSVIRSEDGPSLFPDSLPMPEVNLVSAAEQAITTRIDFILKETLSVSEWYLTRVTLPWRRRFEVEVDIKRRPTSS